MSCTSSASLLPCRNAFDGNNKTEWITDGQGEGAFITAIFGEATSIASVSFQSYGGRNVRTLRLTYDDGDEDVYNLTNTNGVLTTVLDSPVKTKTVRLTFDAIYPHDHSINHGANSITFLPDTSNDLYECCLGTECVCRPPYCGRNAMEPVPVCRDGYLCYYDHYIQLHCYYCHYVLI